MNPNQEFALAQLRRISALSGGAVSLGRVEEVGERAAVTLRLALGTLPHTPSGIEIEPTETFLVAIGPDFPNAVPVALVLHNRWNGTPHVEYHGQLCLYLAPSIEWIPADGMHGFLERLVTWLEHAALGILDPPGAPHPPVASPDFSAPPILVRADAGEPSLRLIFGVARRVHSRLELSEWSTQPTADGDVPVVAAFTAERIPTFVYPETVGGLINCLAELGFATPFVVDRITEAAAAGHGSTDVTVLIGAGLREGRGGPVTDHFVAWRVPGPKAEEMAIFRARGAVEGHENATSALQAWCAEKASYHILQDARAESVVRRDEGSPVEGFAGKSVEIWGAGALGGWMAELVVRAGAAQVEIKDKSWVGPGVLVRQPYSDADVLQSKAHRLAERLDRINSQTQVTGSYVDVVSAPLPTVDVLIDVTANRSVASALEQTRRRARAEGRTLPVVASAVTDAEAAMLLVTVAGPEYSGAAIDISRKTEARIAPRPECEHFREAFWVDLEAGPLLRPEPGCSDPTFRGSAADSAALAAAAVTQIGGILGDDTMTRSGTAVLSVVMPAIRGELAKSESFVSLTFDPDIVVPVADEDYEVRIAAAADEVMREVIRASIVTEGEQPETGGLLFGDRDDAVGTSWISFASPPPPDSTASEKEFVCGTVGTQRLTDRYARESGDTITYVGMWHSHPGGRPCPSPRDRRTMAEQAVEAPHRTYVIAGGDPAAPNFAAYLGPYEVPAGVSVEAASAPAVVVAPPARAATTHGVKPAVTREVWDPLPQKRRVRSAPVARRSALEEGSDAVERHPLDPLPDGIRPVGLALSGGGFRASLAGLGALRYLADADLLHRVRLVSSVSGGSVLNGAFAQAYAELRNRQFAPEAFDELVLQPFLQTVTESSFTARLKRNLWRAVLPGSSRATVLEHCLDQRFFGGTLLEELPTGCWFEFNAANVATGARFRFNRDLAGDYQVGSISTSGSGLHVATAVAASAAVPGLFSPMRLDSTPFPCGDDHEVVLVDGGAYDNLGLDAITKRPELFFVALNAGGLFRPPRSGRHLRIPVVADLRRANSVLYRQVSAVRSRWLMGRVGDGLVDGVMATLWTSFSASQRKELSEWTELAPEQDAATCAQLAGTATSFGRFDSDVARALVYRAWWLTGATFALHQRHLVPELPGWRAI